MRLLLFGLVSAALVACSGSNDTGGLANGQGAGSTTESPKAPAPGGGASSKAPEQTPPPSPPAPTPEKCDVSFGKEVLPALAQHGCQAAQCHGGFFQKPTINVLDPAGTYASFTQFKLREGLPYVKPNAKPEESGIHCHVRNECGEQMPPNGGKINGDVVDLIDDWLKCGAPNN